MTFAWFRKHEKTFLWIAVAFTVVVFALFSSMSDVERLFDSGEGGDDPGGLAGTFKVAGSGDTVEVTRAEYGHAYNNLARLSNMLFRSSDGIEEDAVWAHIIAVADARAAGMSVSDAELARQLTGGQPLDRRTYEQVVLSHRFSSLQAFESFFRDYLVAQRYMAARQAVASALPADEVYLRWRVDNELFDLDTVIFSDRDPDTIPDPGSGTLEEWFDELPEFQRNSLFSVPAQHDILFAYARLDGDAVALFEGLDEAVLEKVPEPAEAEVLQRFNRVKASRFPDMESADEATLEVLRAEVRLLALAAAAHAAFRTGETTDEAAFRSVMEAHGLTLEDPEGALDPDALEALDLIGDDLLALRLNPMKVGDSQSIPSLRGDEDVAAVLFLQDKVEAVPQTFAEAGDKVLTEWRKTQVDQAARDFRESLREATLALTEVAEAVAPLEAQALEAAEAAIAEAIAAVDAGPGAEPISEERMEEIRAAERDAIQPEIDLRVAEHEHQVWETLLVNLGDVVERTTYRDVPRTYWRTLTPEDRDPDSLEQFVKGNFAIYQLDEDGITDVLRFAQGEKSVIVRVASRRFPDEAAMFADTEGMLSARQSQGFSKMATLQEEFSPQAIMAAHDLKLVERPPEAQVGGSTDEEPAQDA